MPSARRVRPAGNYCFVRILFEAAGTLPWKEVETWPCVECFAIHIPNLQPIVSKILAANRVRLVSILVMIGSGVKSSLQIQNISQQSSIDRAHPPCKF
jgi:hypothetical protein